MARTAKVTVIIDDNGTMRLTEASAKKLGKSLDKVSKSAHDVDRGMRGTAQMSSNSTKNFAKQSQMMGGVLVPAYAALAAQVFALTAAFRFFQSAADLRVLEQGQLAYAASTGVALGAITKSLQDATDGQLNFRDAAQAASIGAAAGLSATTLKRLATVAKQASVALGRDLTDSFNRLIKGSIKAEPELLDELDIIVRLDDAAQEYGRSIGVAAKDLTTFQKSQAVVNAVLTQGESKFGKFNIKVNEVNRAGKAFNDLLINLQESIAPFVELLAKAVAQSGLFAAAIAGFAFAGPIRSMLPDIRPAGGLNKADIGKSIVDLGYTGKFKDKLSTGEFTGADLDRIQKSVNAATSSVIQGGKDAQQAVGRAVGAARASILYDVGVMQGGLTGFFTKLEAQWIAATAQGTGAFTKIKAAGLITATVLGTAFATLFNVIAIAGLLYTLGELAVTWIKSLSPLADYKEQLDNSTQSLEAQRKEAIKVASVMKYTSQTISQRAVAISEFSNSIAFAAPPGQFLENFLDQGDLQQRLDTAEAATRTFFSRIASGVTGGGLLGASIGSMFGTGVLPGIGTGIGATVGALTGAITGGVAAWASYTNQHEKAQAAIKVTDDEIQFLTNTLNLLNTNKQMFSDNKGFSFSEGAINDIGAATKVFDQFFKEIEGGKPPTIETTEKILNLIAVLTKDGLAGLGEGTKAAADYARTLKIGADASQAFYKSQVDAATALTKGDIHKQSRDNLKAVLDALNKEFEVTKQVGNVVGDQLKLIFGDKVYDSLKDSEDAAGAFTKKLTDLRNVYVAFRADQIADDIKASSRDTTMASLYMDTSSNKIARNDLALQQNIDNIMADIRQKKLDKLNLEAKSVEENEDDLALLNHQIDRLEKKIENLKEANIYANDQIKFQERLNALQQENNLQNNDIKIKQLALDKRMYDFGVKSADLAVEEANAAVEQNQRTIDLYANLEEIADKEQQILDTARNQVGVLNAQVTAAERNVEIAKEELRIRRLMLNTDIAREGNKQERLLVEASILPSRVKEEALAQLQKQDLLLQAEQLLVESKKQGILPEQRKHLEIQAQNLKMEADLVELRLGRAYQLSQELLKETETGMSNVLQAAFMGDSVGDAALIFIQSFAKALNDAVTKALVDAMMTSKVGKGIMGGIMSIGSSLFGGGARYGGMFTQARYGMMPAYAEGGVSRGRDSGYPVMLHGTEAVVPLQDGKNIPVKMTGNSGNTNNVSVNVTVANGQATTQVSSKDSELRARAFGQALSEAVKQEIIIQSREGGLLNRI